MEPAHRDYRASTAELLADRVRIGLWLSVGGICLFWIADRGVQNVLGQRLIHLLMLCGLLVGYRFVRKAADLDVAVALTFAMMSALVVATAAVCTFLPDVPTAVLMLFVIVMGAGTLLPWGPGVQAALVLVAGFAAALLMTYFGNPMTGRPIVGAAFAFSASVVVAGVVDRERRERWVAEQALARSQEQLASEAAVSGTLARVTREMISLLESPAILRRLGAVTVDTLSADCSHTFLWSPREEAFVVIAGCGGDDGHVRAAEGLRVSRPALAAVLDEIRNADCGVAMLGTALPPTIRCPARATIAMALTWGDEVVGVHTAGGSTRLSAMTDTQRRFASGLAQTVSQALAKARTVEELRASSSQKSEFVSTMSHELRTPINVLLGYLEMLDDPGVGATERHDLGTRMRASGRDLLELVEAMLELGRIESGRDRPREETVRLPAFWAQLGDACRRLPRAVEVALEWSADVPDVEVVTDPRKLTIVVRNLVGNALKFTEHGFVAASLQLEDGKLLIDVRDTGIGIRHEEQAVVFEMFRQAADGSRRQGSGLGLHIVRTFVAQMGGDVRLESVYGVGSRFVVTLPLAGGSTAQAA
jgi:signal transduction histidine kinase